MRTAAHIVVICTLIAPVFAAEPPKAVVGEAALPATATPEDVFLRFYELGATAVQQRNWVDADLHFTTALKMLGTGDHPKKDVAEILQKKAKDQIRQNRQLIVGDELMRLKQWEEAEAAYLRASKTLGLTEAIQGKIDAARDASRVEKGLPTLAEEQATAKARLAKDMTHCREALAKGDLSLARAYLAELEKSAKELKVDMPEITALRTQLLQMVMEEAKAKANQQDAPVPDRKNKFVKIPPDKVKDQF